MYLHQKRAVFQENLNKFNVKKEDVFMAQKVLVIATNYGSWGEELQAPWDILNQEGYAVTLATPLGKKPLPLKVSVDPEFVDPIQKYKVNPPEVCQRIKELVAGDEWAHPLELKDAKMADYDAIVLTGGLGAMLDMCNNWELHRLIREAYMADKLIGALCYAVSTLVFLRNPQNDNRSIIYGKTVTAHPTAWDFYGPGFDFIYDLYGATDDNKGSDVHTPGFLWPLEHLVRDAVGPEGRCIARASTTREDPEVAFDWPFVTGTSVESSIAYGRKLAEVLKNCKTCVCCC
jgi:putative intracellular protease/amidase